MKQITRLGDRFNKNDKKSPKLYIAISRSRPLVIQLRYSRTYASMALQSFQQQISFAASHCSLPDGCKCKESSRLCRLSSRWISLAASWKRFACTTQPRLMNQSWPSPVFAAMMEMTIESCYIIPEKALRTSKLSLRRWTLWRLSFGCDHQVWFSGSEKLQAASTLRRLQKRMQWAKEMKSRPLTSTCLALLVLAT